MARPESYQLGEQIRQCALAYMDKWEEKNIQIRMEVEDIEVCADQALMELVWNNRIISCRTPSSSPKKAPGLPSGPVSGEIVYGSKCRIRGAEYRRIYRNGLIPQKFTYCFYPQ